MNGSFIEFDHTGDLGVEIEAGSREELFAQALAAMASLMVEPEGVEPRAQREIRVNGAGDAELMHDLLAEALVLFFADGFIWTEARVSAYPGGLKATLGGELFDPSRHCLIREIKAVTHHQLSVEPRDGRFFARIIFDV